jgi:hypothetical protein
MQEPAATIQNTLRFLRFFHAALLVSIVLYGLLLRLIPVRASQPPSSLMLTAGGALTVMVLGVGFLARLIYVQSSVETLRTDPEDAGAILRWRLGSILSAVLAESAALFGVVIHFVGGPDVQAAIFIGASAVVMLLWWPRQP